MCYIHGYMVNCDEKKKTHYKLNKHLIGKKGKSKIGGLTCQGEERTVASSLPLDLGTTGFT